MSQFRMKRVNELVKRELSALIRKHLSVESYGLISVTEVDVSKDLKSAHVYISTVGNPNGTRDSLIELEKIRKNLQYELSRKVILKYTPQLLFREDQGLERGQHIVDLLNSMEENSDDPRQNT